MTNLDYLYDKNVTKDYFKENYFVDKTLGFQSVKNGIVIPNFKNENTDYWGISGVSDEQGYLYKGINTMRNMKYSVPSNIEIKKSNKTAIYLGTFAPAWGHDITINLSRLWFLHSAAFKAEFQNCPIVYTPWHKYGWYGGGHLYVKDKQSFSRLLKILEIDPDALQPIEQPTQFDNVIIPDDSFYYSDIRTFSFTEEYRETINRVRNFALKNRTPSQHKKIYFFYGRHQIGEDRLASYFRTKGYATVTPERFPLEEQLNLLINCDSFASTLGSCSHNSLFLRDGSEVILIPRAANAFTFYQQTLGEVHPLNTTYIDSSMSVFGTLHESYCFILSEQLKRFFGDNFWGYTTNDFTTFFEYLKDSMSKGRNINPASKKYYDKVFPDFFMQLWNKKG